MTTLIIVRHSISNPQVDTSAHEWGLSDEGYALCRPLAERLKAYQPDIIVSSEEPKAYQTAQIVAHILDKPFEIETDLHEHLRLTEPYSANLVNFKEKIRELLTKPDEVVFGEESGTMACERFIRAINAILARHPRKNVVAITHGTVMALFVSRLAGVEPVSFWRSLQMPAYIVFNMPDYHLIEVVNSIEL